MSLPNLPSLSKIIGHGSEGGQEFARILNQLLFKDSYLNGYYFQSIDDSAGDYKGVDSIMKKGLTQIGFQYKFIVGSPDSKNKNTIKNSLVGAIKKFPEMEEWILVTPDNFNRYGMEWLEEISIKHSITIKHWGHSEIISFMLKFPNIGNKYYSQQVFKNHLNTLDRKASKEDISLYFNQFSDPNILRKNLFFQAQPNVSDCKKIFSLDIYKEVSDNINILYRDVFDSDRSINEHSSGNGELYVVQSSVEEIKNGKNNMPGGIEMIIDEFNCFLPETTFYSLSVDGIRYSVWFFVNGKWVFVPKPWRMIRAMYDLKKDKKTKRLIRYFKLLGMEKVLNQEDSSESKMLVNRIIHGLTSNKN